MSKNSRIVNTIKNVGIGTALEIFSFILAFVTRKVFVVLLGNDYVSVNGLFNNVLTLLSFTELGIGSAIVYSLYKPIVDEDREKICKLLKLFKDAYTIISISVLVIGLMLIPFLNKLISDVPNVKENIIFLYCLFLLNSVCSYIFGYKKSFLTADQKNYIVIIIYQAVHIFQIVLQIVFLLITHNFVLYLFIMIACTLINNIISTIYTNKKYPWINAKTTRLTKKESKPLFDNIKNIFIYKLGSVLLNGTDNIIISTCIKTAFVGLCDNYTMLINSASTIMMQGFSGITASIGNYNVNADNDSNEKTFKQLNLACFWVVGMITVILACVMTPFVTWWLGGKFNLAEPIVLSLAVSFYFTCINSMPSSYRTAMGFFRQARFAPLMASVINITLSILLAKLIGLEGVFIATSVAKISSFCIIDPYIIYKHGFKKSSSGYFKTFFLRIVLLTGIYFLIRTVLNLVSFSGFAGLIFRGLICVFIYNIIMLVIYGRNPVFKTLIKRLSSTILKKRS